MAAALSPFRLSRHQFILRGNKETGSDAFRVKKRQSTWQVNVLAGKRFPGEKPGISETQQHIHPSWDMGPGKPNGKLRLQQKDLQRLLGPSSLKSDSSTGLEFDKMPV